MTHRAYHAIPAIPCCTWVLTPGGAPDPVPAQRPLMASTGLRSVSSSTAPVRPAGQEPSSAHTLPWAARRYFATYAQTTSDNLKGLQYMVRLSVGLREWRTGEAGSLSRHFYRWCGSIWGKAWPGLGGRRPGAGRSGGATTDWNALLLVFNGEN